MYLKSLTALGFKSFADKTSLNFLPGVSAIVGPNGCGKSNISDAIRWVLGEQSAKALRGGEMADVIFNGTDHRKPLGMAEVSLTIGDVDEENLKAAGVAVAYNELTVTRRVFRDGGSEYFINKTPCRLKDIQQLFMGTGMGRTSYSIMAQGNITQIISSKPDDRRTVFEEAAGITRFKSQKKESLRKLEHTEQNLLRLADLIREVKRQIGSLQRQAGKARRYKQLMVELQHLETQLARHQFDILQTEIRERETSVEKVRLDTEICSESVVRGENEISQVRERLSELEQQIRHVQQQAHDLKAEMERHESRIQFNQERLRELETQNARAQSDIAQGEERKLAAEQELANVSQRLTDSSAILEEHRGTLNVRREELQKVERELSNQQEILRRTQNDAFASAQQLGRVRNEINTLDLQKQGNVVRLEKLSAEKVQLEEERARLEARIQEFEAGVTAEKLSVQASRGTVEERQKRLREIQEQLTQASQGLDTILRQQAEKRSRLHILEQLQADYEGFSSGTLAVLKGAQGVVGSLTDKIKVPEEHIVAIEAALGHNLQLVLTENPEAAEQILADLKNNKKGKANIAPLNLPAIGAVGASLPEGAILGSSVVNAEENVTPLLQRLLGTTLIVPDLGTATRLWQGAPAQFHFVTSAGELLSAQGVYSGGAGNGKPSTSILSRKNQIEQLRVEAERLQEQIAEASRAKGALQSEQTALQASLQQAQTDLRTQEVAIATRQGEFNALGNSLRGLHQKIDTVVYEIQRLAAQEQEGTDKRDKLAAQIAELEGRESSLQAQVTELNTGLDSLRQQRDAATAALTEIKVGLASEEQVCASFRQQQNALTQRVGEIGHLLEQRRGELSSFATRRERSENEIGDSRARISSLEHEREQVNLQMASVEEQKRELEQDFMTRENGLREQRRRLTELQQSRGTLDVELAQKNMAVQNLRQRVQEKYQVNLDDVRSECITITFADEGQPKVETITPEEMQARGLATDWDHVAQQVSTLQEKLDEMGPVNLVAIEEYEETEQRYNFLTSQNEDLLKAKEQLLEVINRINTQTKEMFTETFYKIRENFRNLFTEIFGGGKADLILVNEGDVLESGIDIVARPPGKQLQSISLLSGGEQTMTAVALLFSIYQVKPSPFCLLDELDAPLDESNINRFIRILQRFLSHSQFIIITHNKRTIGMADVLYGVTMEEHGVSKIVSVKFHKATEEIPTTRVATPLVPPPADPVAVEEDKVQPRNQTLEVSLAG
jgi:chromosome segregation protein